MEIIAKEGMKGFDAAEQAGLKKEALVVRVNGEVKELWQELHEGDKVEVLTFADEDGRRAFRHTASHVLAEAIQHVRPGTKYAIGPAIANGFYYDVDSDEPFTAEDLKALEKEMQHLIKKNERVERFELPRAEALKLMQDRNEPYKVELINDLPEDAVISFYTQRRFHRPVRRPAPCRPPATSRPSSSRSCRRRVLARRRKEQDAPAHLRHLLSPRRRSWTSICTASKRRRSATTASSAASSICSCSLDEGPGFPFFLPKGMVLRNILERLLARDAPRSTAMRRSRPR